MKLDSDDDAEDSKEDKGDVRRRQIMMMKFFLIKELTRLYHY